MENPSEDSMVLNSRDKFIVAVEGGLILIINFVAFIGNLLICLIMYKKPRFHTATNTFMVALTVCYGFIACLAMPFTVGALVTGKWLFGQVLCDIQGFAFLALTWISLLTQTLMVVSRFFRVTQSSIYSKCFSLNRSCGMIMAIWIAVITIMICSEALGTTSYRFSSDSALCSMDSSEGDETLTTAYAVITLSLYIMLPVISLIAWCAIKRHNAAVHASGQVQRRSEIEMRIIAEDQKTNRVLFALIIAVLFFWLPAVVIKILAIPISLPRQMHLASTFFWFLVPALHAIIYGVMHRPFSKEILRVLPMAKKRQNEVHAEHSV